MCLAIPGRIVDFVDEPNRIAKVDVGGVLRNVNVALLDDEHPPVAVDDWVLIHVGFAMSRVDEAEARATLDLLGRMGGELEAELEEIRGSRIE